MARPPSYVTKKEFNEHKKEVKKLIIDSARKIKKDDEKHDKKIMKRKSVSKKKD